MCDPLTFTSHAMQSYITQVRAREDQQWVQRLVEQGFANRSETIFIDTEDWVMCSNIHAGADDRYLVVFKDSRLQTLRDLTGRDVPMLLAMNERVRAFLRTQHPLVHARYRVFFHYLPSVFQLHAHVSTKRLAFNMNRRQPLPCVVRNLLHDSEYYRKALILTSVQRCLRQHNIYTMLDTQEPGTQSTPAKCRDI